MTLELYETLKLLSRTGSSNRALGIDLGISEQAVKDRIKQLLFYFAVPNRTALIAKCYRERIV